MSAFYNENDPKAAAWLRELIALRLIADGIVDERSILEIEPHEIAHYSECHFFAGIGGWPLAFRLARVPSGDGKRRWTGSCPCQPFSDAGQGRGTDDERHLWPAFFRLIYLCKPDIVYGEQVASAAIIGSAAKPSKRKPVATLEQVWLDGICADLESAHYACAAGDLPDAGIGAPHRRQRLYWLAVASIGQREAGSGGCEREEGAQREGGADADGRGGERVGAVANAAGSRGAQQRDEPREGSRRGAGPHDAAECAGPCGLADSECPRLEGHAGNGDHGHEPGRERADAAGSTAAGGGSGDEGMDDATGPRRNRTLGDAEGEARDETRMRLPCAGRAWSDFTIIPCRDGKARRIESGTFPLVDGLPRGVVHRRDSGVPINAKATAEARQMRLKGYGNAIVPKLAAEFILACEDAL